MVTRKSLLKSTDAALKAVTSTETGRAHPFYAFKPFDTMRDGSPHPQKAFFYSETRLQAVISGGRSGKTFCGHQKLRCLAINKDPSRPGYRFPLAEVENHPFVIWLICPPDTVRKQLDDLNRGFPKEVKRTVHRSSGKESIHGDPTPERPYGWRIEVKSQEKGLAQFQYAIVHVIAYDEEPPEDIWVECQQRLVSTMGWTLITLTPVYGTTWLYEKLHALDPEFKSVTTGRFGWYSWSIYENKTLSPQAIAEFEAEIKDEDEHAIRILGQYKTLAGDRYFPVEIIKGQRAFVADPTHELVFGPNGKPMLQPFSGKGSGWRLFRKPEAIRKTDVFVIGADTGGGVGKDFSVGQVLDAETGEQVAVFRDNGIEPMDFGTELAYASRYWNDALVFPEMNTEGNAVYRGLKHAGCSRIGRRHAYGGKLEELEGAYGWLTGRHNKAPGLQELLVSMRDAVRGKLGVIVHDERTVAELDRVWHLRDKRPGSQGIGCIDRKGHDDHVMALMIALQATYQAPRVNRLRNAAVFRTNADKDIASWQAKEDRKKKRAATGLAALSRGFSVTSG